MRCIYLSICMNINSHVYLRIWPKLTFCLCCPHICFCPKLNEYFVILDAVFMHWCVFFGLAIRLAAKAFFAIITIMVVFFSKVAAVEVGYWMVRQRDIIPFLFLNLWHEWMCPTAFHDHVATGRCDARRVEARFQAWMRLLVPCYCFLLIQIGILNLRSVRDIYWK